MALSNNQIQFELSLLPQEKTDSENSARSRPSAKPQLFLLDGMALIYRAYFALQRAGMTTRTGIPTGATFGFLTTLLKIFESYSPDYLAVAFDSREKTFRHKLYSQYKANRPEPPEELIIQLETIFSLVEAFSIPVLKQPGYEADDLIGSAAAQFAPDCRVFIVTPDKDMSQLIEDGVTLLKPGKRQNELLSYGRHELEEELGITPEQFTDLLTLTGDTSDNIPGAKGIGPKTASKLLRTYGNIQNIREHLQVLPPKTRISLEEFFPDLELIHDLVTIRTDIELRTTLEKLKCQPPQTDALLPLLEKLELRSILAKLPQLFPGLKTGTYSSDAPTTPDSPGTTARTPSGPHPQADYLLIDTVEEIEQLARTLSGLKGFSIDTETTSLDTFEARLVGISLSWKPRQAVFIDISPQGLSPEEALGALKQVLENPDTDKWGQNLKYDILVLKKYGIDLNPVAFDTMLASYVLDPEKAHNLDDLAWQHLEYATTRYSDLVGKGKKAIPLSEVPKQALRDYACQDADIALQLRTVLQPLLSEEPELERLCSDIEFPLVRVLAEMEYRGVCLDTAHLEKTSLEVSSKLEDLTGRIHEAAGESFNIDSPKQLAVILFEKLGLPAKKATKTGYSTNVQVLEDLAPLHPVVRDILEYRSLQKLLSTYIEALPRLVKEQTGRLHTSFNQHVTATGRLSSSNPNLQNIPVRTELGREIRKAFIASGTDRLLFSADYSQIELRIAAELSGDSRLIDAFRNNEDIHSATARNIFHTETVTDDMRRKAKEVNFGVLYGIQPFGLAQRLNIPRNEAKEIIDTYKATYPGLFLALQDIIDAAAQKGYVTTIMGRRRYIPDLHSRNSNIRKGAERAAMNTPVQGTAADIIKCAMCSIDRTLRNNGMNSCMLLQVHDELVFETDRTELEQLESVVVDAMKEAAVICGLRRVPVEVDTGSGRNWLEAH
jgi:DNA polymerase I